MGKFVLLFFKDLPVAMHILVCSWVFFFPIFIFTLVETSFIYINSQRKMV